MTKFKHTAHGLTRRHRLDGYDYRTPGFYFLTICQRHRRHLFGSVTGANFFPTSAGEMLAGEITDLNVRYPQSTIDAFVVMPNHVHLLIALNLRGESHEQHDSIVHIMNWWKTSTTNKYIKGVRDHGWSQFDGSLWQEGYHDRIIRDERELYMVRKYIQENPERWEDDTYFDD